MNEWVLIIKVTLGHGLASKTNQLVTPFFNYFIFEGMFIMVFNFADVSRLSCSSHCSLLQACLSLSASLWAEPYCEIQAAGLYQWLVWAPPSPPFLPPLCSCLPMFTSRCFNAGISQACLYIEQGILCCIIAVQIVEISGGEIKGIYHTAIPLMSLSLLFFFFFSLEFGSISFIGKTFKILEVSVLFL